MSWASFRDQSLSCSIELPSLGSMGFDWAMHGNLTYVAHLPFRELVNHLWGCMESSGVRLGS